MLRGPDPQRDGRLYASIMSSERLQDTTGIRIGTHSHLETFSVENFPGSPDLYSMAIQADSGLKFWTQVVLPAIVPSMTDPVPEETIVAFATCITGFSISEADDTNRGRLAWLFPISVDDMMVNKTPTLRMLDFSAVRPKRWAKKDLEVLLKRFDTIVSLVTSENASKILECLAGDFAPLVKDLVRWASHCHPTDGLRGGYMKVWAADSFRSKDLLYGARVEDFPFNDL